MTDEELVRSALAGSGDAATEIFDRHWDGCLRVAYAVCGRRELAEDAAQDPLVTAMRRLGQFRGPDLAAWLRRIAVNRTLTLMRGDRRLVSLDHVADAGLWDEVEMPDAALRDGVRALSPERRTVVVLRYWLDMSPPEIAEVLQVRLGTVNSRLARALGDLRAELEVPDAGRA
ncbi:RNA polymerase sigma factor [Miltoncostaea oceani]|uniref:RNA polymerase sigma factor n=1 Tax=Miltoncostaea oceani TaxID=2843216 RepID=UPI001C3DF50C|nr:RNA polymerase sigma factor [Miltoncostaea oceani]